VRTAFGGHNIDVVAGGIVRARPISDAR
jgi:hypothetical protein